MSTSTANYGFDKPDPNELVDVVDDLNDSMDAIDGLLKTLFDNSTLILGGKIRTAPAGVTVAGNEKEVLDTGAITVPVGIICVELCAFFDASAAGDDYDWRIRQSTIAGAVLRETAGLRTANAVPYMQATRYWFKNGAPSVQTYVGSVQRIFGGGTANVQTGSTMIAYYCGPSSKLVDLP